MRPTILFIISVVLFSTVVVCHSAVDPQRQLAEERRRLVRPPEVATPAQRVQPAVQQYSASQRERERNQTQRFTVGNNPGRGETGQFQTVNIDQLKVQSDTPVEYQFESLQTLNVQEGDPSRADEVVKAEPVETAEAEQQGETTVEEVAAAVEETSSEEPEEVVPPVEEKIIQSGAGHALFKIIEEDGRFVVTQVESSPDGVKQVRHGVVP